MTVFQGRAGDRNDLAFDGAVAVGGQFARRLGVDVTTIGRPSPVIQGDCYQQLAAAMDDLQAMAAHYDHMLDSGIVPVAAITRCAVALATLPVVARHRPDACVVWLDAHGDVNTPETSSTGYLGGLAISGAAGLWTTGLGGDLDLSRVVLVGARDLDPPEQALVDGGQLRAIGAGPHLISELRSIIADRPVYLHFDCDVLEPRIVPTEYNVPGGLTLLDMRRICEVLACSELVGLEVAEFQRSPEADSQPALARPLIDALEPLLARIKLAS